MKQQWLARVGSEELILVFGGWALGPAPFAGLSGDRDVLFVDDFRHLDDPLSALGHYERVNLVAFSFGVVSAAHWLAQSGCKPARSIAVGGTLHPADPDRGIAPDVIRGTADQLSQASFRKFCRRAGLNGPVREVDIAAAREELHAVIDRGEAPETTFDRIWIPQKDRIVPTHAQERAWAGQSAAVRRTATPHIPFLVGQSWQEWMT